MQNIFFTSDTHYGHANIIKYSSRSYSSVEEMDECLIENHNKLVKSNDIIYFLGDFAFKREGGIKILLSRLNGIKKLILGNHDKCIKSNPSKYIGSTLFESIDNYSEIEHNKTKICLFHYGCRVWNKSHHGSYLLYGHSHGRLEPFGKSVDVGVDAKFITTDYRPIHVDEIHDYMRRRNFENVDHHEWMER